MSVIFHDDLFDMPQAKDIIAEYVLILIMDVLHNTKRACKRRTEIQHP